MDYVIDENDNKATISYWGSKEAAEASLKTLTNCTNCTNCTDCTDCTNCTECTHCSYFTDCKYCKYCKYCTNCTICTNCTHCSYCTNCIDSTNCKYCTYCTYCKDCTDQPILNTPTTIWTICLRSDYTLKIGCEDHPASSWLQFTDEQISKMNSKALAFWKQWKPVIEVLHSQKDQSCETI